MTMQRQIFVEKQPANWTTQQLPRLSPAVRIPQLALVSQISRLAAWRLVELEWRRLIANRLSSHFSDLSVQHMHTRA